MIVDAIVNALAGVVSFIIGLLPTTPAPPDLAAKVSAALTGASGYFGIVANWFPITELGVAVAGLMIYLAAIHLFRLLAWVLALVHIGGDDG